MGTTRGAVVRRASLTQSNENGNKNPVPPDERRRPRLRAASAGPPTTMARCARRRAAAAAPRRPRRRRRRRRAAGAAAVEHRLLRVRGGTDDDARAGLCRGKPRASTPDYKVRAAWPRARRRAASYTWIGLKRIVAAIPTAERSDGSTTDHQLEQWQATAPATPCVDASTMANGTTTLRRCVLVGRRTPATRVPSPLPPATPLPT